jgi:hypothetical protein
MSTHDSRVINPYNRTDNLRRGYTNLALGDQCPITQVNQSAPSHKIGPFSARGSSATTQGANQLLDPKFSRNRAHNKMAHKEK